MVSRATESRRKEWVPQVLSPTTHQRRGEQTIVAWKSSSSRRACSVMGRPRPESRATITDATLTLRLTQGDRDVLQCLVEHQAKLAAEQGFAIEPTVAGFLRSLIRREAHRLGITTTRNDEG